MCSTEIRKQDDLEVVDLDEASDVHGTGVDKVEHGNQEKQESSSFSTGWSRIVFKIHQPILAFVQWMTQLAATNPKRTMSAVTLFSIALVGIGLFTNFNVDVDEDTLWTPKDAKEIEHSAWIENDSGFPTMTYDLILFFHAEGKNVLGQKEVAKVFEVVDQIRAIENYGETCSESTYIGENNQNTCEVEGVTRFWNSSSDIFEANILSDEDAIAAMSNTSYPDGSKVSENSIFGYPERDASGTLTKAIAYTVVFRLPPTDAGESFEDDALDLLLDMRRAFASEEGNSLRLELTSEGSFGDEFERAILKDLPLIPIVFCIMSIFTAIVFAKWDRVKSRSLLGFGAVVGVLLSLMSGFGLLFICNVPFTSMTQILPFVLFGIGVDDAFIIYGSYSRTESSSEVTKRIQETMDDVAVSITLTSMTSSLAFGLGALSSIPAVYWLCYYAFPTIIFIYFYQLTFFIAWIVLDERRIKANKRDCCFCVSVDKKSCEGGDESGDDTNVVSDNQTLTKDSLVQSYMASYAKVLLKPAVKAGVIISFTSLAVVCSISAAKHEQAFSFTEVMPDDSYVVDFFDAFEDYTRRTAIAPFAYFRYVDQSDETIQNQMQTYVNDLVGMDAVSEKPEFFWLRDFQTFVESEGLEGLAFNQQIDSFLSKAVWFDLYNDHIVRNQTGHITSSRVEISFDNIDQEDVKQQIDVLEEQCSITKRLAINKGEKSWPFFSYDGIYNIWVFYSVVRDELIFTTIMGVVAVTGVALLFIPHWTGALFVLPIICVLYVDLLGFMKWCGVDINPVSYISLVMSIGLLVDFIMHVLLRFYECQGNRREKTTTMLKTMGTPIFIGGISTFLGTLPLAFSTSTIFFTIFITFLGLVLLGLSHGLILLPVLLDLFGPEDKMTPPKDLSDKNMDETVERKTIDHDNNDSSSS